MRAVGIEQLADAADDDDAIVLQLRGSIDWSVETLVVVHASKREHDAPAMPVPAQLTHALGPRDGTIVVDADGHDPDPVAPRLQGLR
jgi:hypothetical protein